jgi:hypothetical protein
METEETTTVPMPRQQIQLVDANNEIKAITFVEEVVSYCMNGCYKVRDKNGVVRLVTRARDGKRPAWKSVTLHF